MTRDEIREIAQIVGGDKTYRHFVRRINKEFDSSDENRNSEVYVLYAESGGRKIGFSVIGHSPAKMSVWKNVFREEGWIDQDFKMAESPYELMYMYVKPEYRNKGFGEKLFKKVLEFTKGNQVKEIYAYIGDRSLSSLLFYKKMKCQVLKDLSDSETTSAFLRWIL